MDRTNILITITCFFTATLAVPAPGAAESSAGSSLQTRIKSHTDFISFEPSGRTEIPHLQQDNEFLTGLTQFDDLLISENDGAANFEQDKADIIGLRGGRIACVWEDNRFGPAGILLQLFSHDGNPIGGNTTLVLGTEFDLQEPVICTDTTGRFFAVWREGGNGHLQAARFDSTGNIITSIFFVSDTTLPGFAGDFDAACRPDGKLAVAWESYSLGNNIVYRLLDTDGTPITPIITVNTDSPMSRHWSPAITIGLNNDVAIAWEDYRSDTPDIYFRFFSAGGIPYFSEYPLSDLEARDSGRFMPDLVYSTADGYIAGWTDLREGTNIYLQRVTPAGSLQGHNILLTGGTSQDQNWEVGLAVDNLAHLIAVWTLYDQTNSVMLQRFSDNFQMQGVPLEVSSDIDIGCFGPTVTGVANGFLAAAWTALNNGRLDIRGTVLDGAGNVVQVPFLVNDDLVGSPSFDPDVAAFSQYEWVAVFTDQRRDAGDIILQRIYVGEELLGVNRRVNADGPGGLQSEPAIAAGIDMMCVSWTDNRGEDINQNIVCRFTHTSGDMTDEIIVSDGTGTYAPYGSDVAVNDDSITVIVWADPRAGVPKIFGQLFDAGLAKIEGNFLIGPVLSSDPGEDPKVIVFDNSAFLVAYLNQSNQTIEVKRVSIDGFWTPVLSFASDRSGYVVNAFDIARAPDNKFYLAWQGYSAGQTDLFLTGFDDLGQIISPTRAITDDFNANPGWPSIAANQEGYLLVTWLDRRTGEKTPYRQIFDPALLPIQGNTPVYVEAGPFMQKPVAGAAYGRGIFVWADARENGLNVYGSLVYYSPTDVDDGEKILPSAYELAQNYPNPFNPSTIVQFSLPRASHVSISVFNLLGQRIRVLADGNYPAGIHKLVWDGKSDQGYSVASGVYFYRMQSDDFLQTRKMILMK